MWPGFDSRIAHSVIFCLCGVMDNASLSGREDCGFESRQRCKYVVGNLAEWLRRQIRNLMGSARGGSNPSVVDCKHTTHTMHTLHAWMAEWSKAADLSSVIFGCVGSNPTSGTFLFVLTATALSWGYSSIGRARALQARGTGIETRYLHHKLD